MVRDFAAAGHTAKVPPGGIDTDGSTLAANTIPGLYATGEAVDVTGGLGG